MEMWDTGFQAERRERKASANSSGRSLWTCWEGKKAYEMRPREQGGDWWQTEVREVAV